MGQSLSHTNSAADSRHRGRRSRCRVGGVRSHEPARPAGWTVLAGEAGAAAAFSGMHDSVILLVAAFAAARAPAAKAKLDADSLAISAMAVLWGSSASSNPTRVRGELLAAKVLLPLAAGPPPRSFRAATCDWPQLHRRVRRVARARCPSRGTRSIGRRRRTRPWCARLPAQSRAVRSDDLDDGAAANGRLLPRRRLLEDQHVVP